MEADGGSLGDHIPKGTDQMQLHREKESKPLGKPVFWGGFIPCAGKGISVTSESPYRNQVLSTTAREYSCFQT